jgi:HrpA-like RNA helicase
MKNAYDVRKQLARLMKRFGLKLVSIDPNSPDYYVNIQKALLSGFFMQVAYYEYGHYATVNDHQIVSFHPSTVMSRKPDWVIYHEFLLTSERYIRTVTEICPELLLSMFPDYYDLSEFPEGDVKNKLMELQARMAEKRAD